MGADLESTAIVADVGTGLDVSDADVSPVCFAGGIFAVGTCFCGEGHGFVQFLTTDLGEQARFTEDKGSVDEEATHVGVVHVVVIACRHEEKTTVRGFIAYKFKFFLTFHGGEPAEDFFCLSGCVPVQEALASVLGPLSQSIGIENAPDNGCFVKQSVFLEDERSVDEDASHEGVVEVEAVSCLGKRQHSIDFVVSNEVAFASTFDVVKPVQYYTYLGFGIEVEQQLASVFTPLVVLVSVHGSPCVLGSG